MPSWHPHEIHFTQEQLQRLKDTLSEPFDAIVDVGSPSAGLVSWLRYKAQGKPVISTQDGDSSGVRPSKEVTELLRSKRVLVILTEPPTEAVFMWASALVVEGGAILVRSSHDRAWPEDDFARISCETRTSEDGLFFVRRRAAQPSGPQSTIELRPRPRRPLRSVFIGHLVYGSYYRLGVAQGMWKLGAWHREVSIFDSPHKIARQVAEVAPDIIWTHMLLWAPHNAAPVYELLRLCRQWRDEYDASIIIQDGDPRTETRFPHDVSDAVDVALVNYDTSLRAEWNVPRIHWPYAALAQDQIGDVVPSLKCELGFAGTLRDSGVYEERTKCIRALIDRGIRTFPGPDGVNTFMQITDIAPSCGAMLGFGRPEVPGWLDARIFTVPGAGGVLIHDDVGGLLEPGNHFIQCKRYDVESIFAALDEGKKHGPDIRRAAFDYIQAKHTYVHRCRQAVDALFEP